jgi:hypothetical protein
MVLEAGKSKIEGLATFKNLPVEEKAEKTRKKGPNLAFRKACRALPA